MRTLNERNLKNDNIATGPLMLLQEVVQTNQQVLIDCRNNRKILARVKAFDRHFNMVLTDAREVWTTWTRKKKKNGVVIKEATKQTTDRHMSKIFLRGDNVVLVLRNPFTS